MLVINADSIVAPIFDPAIEVVGAAELSMLLFKGANTKKASKLIAAKNRIFSLASDFHNR